MPIVHCELELIYKLSASASLVFPVFWRFFSGDFGNELLELFEGSPKTLVSNLVFVLPSAIWNYGLSCLIESVLLSLLEIGQVGCT